MDLENRMKIMKFYEASKKRWEKTHASKLSLNEYLSWLVSPDKDLDPTTQKSISGGVEINEIG